MSVDAYAQHRVNTLPLHVRTSNDVTFNFVTSMDVKAVREVSLMSGSALCLNGQADNGQDRKVGGCHSTTMVNEITFPRISFFFLAAFKECHQSLYFSLSSLYIPCLHSSHILEGRTTI